MALGPKKERSGPESTLIKPESCPSYLNEGANEGWLSSRGIVSGMDGPSLADAKSSTKIFILQLNVVLGTAL